MSCRFDRVNDERTLALASPQSHRLAGKKKGNRRAEKIHRTNCGYGLCGINPPTPLHCPCILVRCSWFTPCRIEEGEVRGEAYLLPDFSLAVSLASYPLACAVSFAFVAASFPSSFFW